MFSQQSAPTIPRRTPAIAVDIFCRVIDNYGDAAVCWRLAKQLHNEHKWQVRLWIDQADVLGHLIGVKKSPAGEVHDGVEIRQWPLDSQEIPLSDCVIEAFGCRMPASHMQTMAAAENKPRWINLEYLTAESWADDCHLQTSPNPRLPLHCQFFIPGFTAKSGGVLRESGLRAKQQRFLAAPDEARSFWGALGGAPKTSQTPISLFCYPQEHVRETLQSWALGDSQALILVNETLADQLKLPEMNWGALEIRRIPFLDQQDYDRLLWSCALNFVRGEDSFIRAQWANKPFIWQAYPQSEQAHHAKLNAFLNRFLASSPEAPSIISSCFLQWNRVRPGLLPDLRTLGSSLEAWGTLTFDWANMLEKQPDLAHRLASLVERRLE